VDSRNITNIVQLSQGYAMVTLDRTDPATNVTGEVSFVYQAVGIDEEGRLYTEGTYPLKAFDTSRFGSEREVWDAVRDDPSMVILDGSAGEAVGNFGISMGGSGFTGTKVGDTVRLTAPGGNISTVTVVGITEQSTFSAVFMNRGYVSDALRVNGTNLFLIKLARTPTPTDRPPDSEPVLGERDVHHLDEDHALEAVSQIDGMFNLIKAFLALGLSSG
jgi:hypothetical protein